MHGCRSERVTVARLVCVAGIALLAPAGSAHALDSSGDAYLNFCTVGALRACASIQILTQPIPGGGTRVWVRFRNLQGTHAADNLNAPSALRRIRINAAESEFTNVQAEDTFITTEGGATVTGVPATYWELEDIDPGDDDDRIEIELDHFDSSGRGGIFGCMAPQGLDHYSTCGEGQWVTFNFTTGNDWSASGAFVEEVEWEIRGGPDFGQRYKCKTGDPDSCVQESTVTTVTPEPVTILLLGSGLVGVGAATLRRRRKSGMVT